METLRNQSCDFRAPRQAITNILEECPLRRFPEGLPGQHQQTPAVIQWLSDHDIPI